MYTCHDSLILLFASYTGGTDDPLADLSEVLNTDDDILGILSDDLVKSGDHSGMYFFRVCLVFVFFHYRCVIDVFVALYLSYLGDFRWSFAVLRISQFEMILFSVLKKPNLSTFCFTWLFALLLKRKYNVAAVVCHTCIAFFSMQLFLYLFFCFCVIIIHFIWFGSCRS